MKHISEITKICLERIEQEMLKNKKNNHGKK
jgi:hypothetical protein